MSRGKPIAPPLPQNAAAERAILGAVLLDNKYLTECEELRPIDFFAPTAGGDSEHRVIFTAMRAMREAGMAIDLLTLTDHLDRGKQLSRAGGAAYIAGLIDGLPATTNIAHWIELVREKARLRSLAHAAQAVYSGTFDATANSDELLTRFRDATVAVAKSHTNGHHDYGQLGYPLSEFLMHDFPVYEHLIPGLIPAHSNVLLFARPHHLKSYLTLGLALAGACGGTQLGMLNIPRPFRTIVVQIEEESGELQTRLRNLLLCDQFKNMDPDNLWIVDRNSFRVPAMTTGQSEIRGFSPQWISWFTHRATEFKPDLIIYDVLRRFFVGHGDPNSPEDSSRFLEDLDLIRERIGCSNMLVAHDRKSEGDLFSGASGSANFVGWAGGAIMRTQHKKEDRKKGTASVELEVDVKLGRSIDECRLVAEFIPRGETTVIHRLRLEPLEAGEDVREIKQALGPEWTVLDLAGHMGVHRKNAWERMKFWWAEGTIEKVNDGKRGRGGSLARWKFINDELDTPPVHIRHVQ